MSDEEKEAINKISKLVEYLKKWNENFTIVPKDAKYFEIILNMTKTHVRMIDENIEEILELTKEIEELKEKNKPQPDCSETIERTEEMVNMRWVNHNYILKTESTQKEKQAWIEGTNVADKLCNKKWKAKINAKIEDLKENSNGDDFNLTNVIMLFKSLLEKE